MTRIYVTETEPDPQMIMALADKDERIIKLEVALRRAIHLVETIRPLVMWPMGDEDTLYDDQWASLTLELIREALAGKET